jgi:hypothetical protein
MRSESREKKRNGEKRGEEEENRGEKEEKTK